MIRMNVQSSVSLAAAVSFVVAAGCSASSEAPVASGAVDVAQSALGGAGGRGWDIPMNGLRTDALVRNLLSTNYDNSGELVASPLTTATFAAGGGHPALAAAANEPATREFLRYAVACALGPDQSLEVDSSDGAHVMGGELGLCPQWGAGNGSASIACQERVSACLLLFNNPLAVTVPVSVRGQKDDANHLILGTRVKPVTVVADKGGMDPAPPISSFASCTPGARGVDTNCGYDRSDDLTGYVGTCTTGEPVRVSTGAACTSPAIGSSSGDTVLRVCDGLRGCDAGSSAVLAANDDACGGLFSHATFTCPTSGVYSVMLAGWDRDAAITAYAASASSTPAAVKYPALEIDLFSIREGAFFGNIFRRDALRVSYTYDANGQGFVGHPRAPSPNQFPTPYGAMFACHDASYTRGAAYLSKRLCSAGLGACAAQPVGDCATMCAAAAPPPSRYGAVGACSYAGTWSWPMTSFLHSRNDVLGPLCGADCN